jgi:pSer/pThr/pTyr-binding forkhead associated (FHA) protein
MPNYVVLKGVAGDLRGRELALSSRSPCVVGRSRSCNVTLTGDPSVSRQHCLIEVDHSGAWVQDLGSLNGTHLNGERIGARPPRLDEATMIQPPRQPLRSGDELRVCNNVFHIEFHDRLPPFGPFASSGTCLDHLSN